MSIYVHIDRLVLDGLAVDAAGQSALQAAVDGELSRLLTENGLAADLKAGGSVPGVNAAAIQLTLGHSPTQMGTQIARSVYSGIGNTR